MSILQKLKDATPKPVKITVESWGDEEVFIMPFSIKEREEFDTFLGEDPAAVMIATTLERIVEENGDRVFDEDNDDHMEIFNSLSSDGLVEVYRAICSKEHRQSAEVKGARGNLRKRRK